eukprot:15325234-Ditylum_brightwellii.AAC.1
MTMAPNAQTNEDTSSLQSFTNENFAGSIGYTKGGVNIAFENITYSVKVKIAENGTLTILRNLSGSFIAGNMMALMGPSGSGKSTLLDVLSG